MCEYTPCARVLVPFLRAYIVLVAGTDVEHGHGAVGGAAPGHELLGAHAWGVQGWRRRGRPARGDQGERERERERDQV